MKPELAAKILGAAAIVHALETLGYPRSALNSIASGGVFQLAIGLLNLFTWLLLVASGIGLLLNKQWAYICTIVFALLSPLSMMLFLPLVGGLLPPGPVLFGGLIVVNFSVAAFATYLRRSRKSVIA